MSEENTLERIEKLLQLLVGLKLDEVRGDRPQKEMILLLSDRGFAPTQIAELLGIKTTSVNPVLSRARRSSKKK